MGRVLVPEDLLRLAGRLEATVQPRDSPSVEHGCRRHELDVLVALGAPATAGAGCAGTGRQQRGALRDGLGQFAHALEAGVRGRVLGVEGGFVPAGDF